MTRITAFLTLVATLLAALVASAQRPNILIAIGDDWSYPHAGAYGCTWVKTPAFDRVAAEGVLFTRAYTPNAKCAPSRAAILTGRNSWQLKEGANHWNFFPPEFMTYAEALADAGYFTGFTAKGWAPGIARTAKGQPRALLGKRFDDRKLSPPTTGISNNDYAGNFTDFLDDVPGSTPWCFWYGSTEPHRQYEYGTGVSVGGKDLGDIDRVPKYWPDNKFARNDMLDYALETEHFDAHLGRMLDELERRGMLENTLVLVTADNGMPFPRAKGQAYEISNHLPLAIQWPASMPVRGRVVDDYITFIDIAPTFLAAAGIEWDASGMAPTPGRSLLPLLESSSNGTVDPSRDHVLIGKERHDIGRPNDWGYPIRGIIHDGWLYVVNYETDRWPAGNPETGYLNCDGGAIKTNILALRRDSGANRYWDLCFGKRPPEELYYLAADPDCVINLVDREANQIQKQSLRVRMEARLKAQGDPRMAGNGAVFDNYPYADERFKGYYKKFQSGHAPEAGWIVPSDVETEPLD